MLKLISKKVHVFSKKIKYNINLNKRSYKNKFLKQNIFLKIKKLSTRFLKKILRVIEL